MNRFFRRQWLLSAILLTIVLVLFYGGCTRLKPTDRWDRELNDRLIKENSLQVRVREDVPDTKITPSHKGGVVSSLQDIAPVEIAPNIKSRMYWGKGILTGWVEMAPGAKIVPHTRSQEQIVVVREGSLTQVIGNQRSPMKVNDFVIISPDMLRGATAGPEGCTFVEVISPVPADYLVKMGEKIPRSQYLNPDLWLVDPSHTPGKIFNLADVQYTELVPDLPGAPSRLIWGNAAQLSFLDMYPNTSFPLHNHPEEQLMIAFRGKIEEGILDYTTNMEKDAILNLPAGMVHSGALSDLGCDVLDVFWPVRPDYLAKAEAQEKAYRAIVPKGAAIEELASGFTFTEGPAWKDGYLYFGDMYFEPENNWYGDAKRGQLIKMAADGSWKTIIKGRQMNGTMFNHQGNLVVCDMFGHKVIEVDPATGRVIRTLASACDGVRIDGPNDLVIDAKGGIYFTDPQFTDTEKTQPGKAVYYIRPNDRKVIRVIPHGEYGMPNGCLLSPDGKTFYVNNTWEMPGANNIFAYDVQDDGTLTNKRKFCDLYIPASEKAEKRKNSGADGMTIDEQGNLYTTSYLGVQIFSPQGKFIGIISFDWPVSITFGGDDMKTLYLVARDKVYFIPLKAKGLTYPLGS